MPLIFPTNLALTKVAHALVGAVLRDGDIAVDATLGNGHDTAFLADRVGASGWVYGFDVQPQALTGTAAGLGDNNRVTLFNASHAELAARIPAHDHGRIRAVMFNLGYLPGGDKRIITDADSTLTALTAALALLAPDGIVTVIAYPGHAGGDTETERVKDACNRLAPGEFEVGVYVSDAGNTDAPVLLAIRKTGA